VKHELRDERGLGSLPVIADWQEWWRYWGPRIADQHGKAGWILFLLAANERIQEVSMLLSRLVRNKPEYDTRGWSAAEWLNVEEQTAAALAWFEANAPAPMRDAPEWAQFLFSAQHGNLAVLKRLGRELRALQEQGYLVATIERRPGVGLELGADAKEVVFQEAD
jgi:hypothetical protein